MIERHDPLDDATAGAIASFLAAQPDARLDHDPRWGGVLRRAMGHRPLTLLYREAPGGAIRGYLALCRVSSPLFGRFLVSLPYLNEAGVVIDAGLDEEAHEAVGWRLVEAAIELAEQFDVKYLELRHGSRTVDHRRLYRQRTDKVAMRLALPSDAAALDKAIGSKVRNQVRKGDKAGLTLAWGGAELVDEFYDVFARNMRDLGTPVYPRGLFAAIVSVFADEAELAVVRHGGRAVAAALLMHDGGGGAGRRPATTAVPSASCLREANAVCANMWLYRALLGRAIERGSTVFDFGRSTPESGTYRFKKQWGATPEPCTWQYHARRGAIDVARPDNPRYQRRIETWQKLPVWLTRAIGPAIVRGIP